MQNMVILEKHPDRSFDEHVSLLVYEPESSNTVDIRIIADRVLQTSRFQSVNHLRDTTNHAKDTEQRQGYVPKDQRYA